MFILEYKQLYIPRESLTKNRCFQGYRWKQIAMCEERALLEAMIPRGKEKEYQIVEQPGGEENEKTGHDLAADGGEINMGN